MNEHPSDPFPLVAAADNAAHHPDYLARPLALRAMFMQPIYLAQSAWLEHIPFAFWLMEAHRPRTFVELGTHFGVSYFAFCQAVQHLSLPTQCYAVDHWKGDAQAGLNGGEVFDRVEAQNDIYSTFSRLVRNDFNEAVHYFPDCSIDLLHIDGPHTFEAIERDFKTWRQKLSDRAIVLFHGSNVRERNYGVWRLVEQLRDALPVFEFVHGHGLAVVAAGQQQGVLVGRLFESCKDEQFCRSVQEVFARLGKGCADRFAAAQSLEQFRKQQDETQDLKRRLGNAKSELSATAAALAETRARAEERAVERAQLLERIAMLQDIRAEMKAEIARLNTIGETRHGSSDMEWSQFVREKDAALAEAVLELGRVRSETTAIARELIGAQSELERGRRELAELVRQKDVALANAGRAMAEARLAQDSLDAARGEVARLTEQANSAQAMREDAEKRLLTEQNAINRLESQLIESAQQSTAATSELEARLQERFSELAALTSRLQETEILQVDGVRQYRQVMAALLAASSRLGWSPAPGRPGSWNRARIKKAADLLRRFELIDPDWYLQANEDVRKANMDPCVHFIRYGADEGRAPNAIVQRMLAAGSR